MLLSTPKLYAGILMVCTVTLFITLTPKDTSAENQDIWISAYFASWEHYAPPGGNWGNLPADEIDFDAFTHLIYFALSVSPDGSLSEVAPYENLNPDRLESIVSVSHNNDTPVLISVGGWGNYNGFSSAIEPGNRADFVDNLVTFIDEWGFDGIDLDMEPIKNSDLDNFKAFVQKLHSELQNHTTPHSGTPLLAAATDWQPGLFADLQEYFDQINLMTYDHSGAWEGWVTWHNSNIYNGGHSFPEHDSTLPSTHKKIQSFLDAGVEPSKLGMGLDFYGYRWNGVSEPLESWDSAPTVEDNIAYYELAQQYDIGPADESHPYYEWDEEAAAAYLSIDDPEEYDDPVFISYDNERTAREKVAYAREHDLGGMIIWELAGGHQHYKPEGERDMLLQSVKEAYQEEIPEASVTLEAPEITYPDEDVQEVPVNTDIKWEPINGADVYEVLIDTNTDLAAVKIDTTVTSSEISLNDLREDTEYYYKIRAIAGEHTGAWTETNTFSTMTVTSAEDEHNRPGEITLQQNYPNPFNPATTIEYHLPEATPVVLEVFSMEGRSITVLVDENQSAGTHQISYDASHLASGVYMYRLRAGDFVETHTMTLVK